MRATPEEQMVAWAIVALLLLWIYAWKLGAFWKAARRGHTGWYVLFAVQLFFGVPEMIYVFWIAPRHPERDAGVGF
jgi:hypothetical protein